MRTATVMARIAMLLACAGVARAEPPPTQEEQARRHFVAGQAHYHDGRWREALAEFELGYALAPRPEFLINFAQAHRKLGQYDKAIVECESFLATAPPPAVAAEARRLVASIREEQAQAQVRPPSEPPPVVVAPPPIVVAPPPVVVAPPVIVAPSPAPPPRRSRAWVWGVVVPIVAVAAAGVAIGVALAFPANTYPSEPLGRVSFR